VGGAPAVVGVDEGSVGVAELRHALAATSALSGALIMNWRRVFISLPQWPFPEVTLTSQDDE
jgi:hypothetical protein